MGAKPRVPEALPSEIAFVTDARAWGGAEVYLTQLLVGFRRLGIRTKLYCADRRVIDDWADDLKSQGIEVAFFRPTKEFNPLGVFVAWRCLRGYEFVHVNKTQTRNSLPAIIGARLAGAATVVTTEHLAIPIESHYPFGRAIITTLARITNRLVDRVIAVSELSRTMLIENYSLDPSTIVTVRNGIDLARFRGEFDSAPLRRELGLAEDDLVAIFVGRLTPRKGHAYALEAAPSVLAAIPGFKLLFVGEGELETELRRRARTLGIEDSVVFAGFRRDIAELLAASDLLILPSESECLPLTILEAMASGLPVVAGDVGGVSEEVEDAVTGLLVQPRDADGLAKAIVAILGAPDHGAGLGAAGREKVEAEFSLDACISGVLRVYDELLNEVARR